MKELNNVIKARTKFNEAIGILERKLADSIDFEFCIQDAAGDGLCVLHLELSLNISIGTAIKFYNNKEKLTTEYVLKYAVG